MDQGSLNLNIDQLNADWKIMNEHGFTHVYLEGQSDLTVTAQGTGSNLRNPEVWEEVNEDESWGMLTQGKGSHRLLLLTETGEIYLSQTKQ